MLKKFYVFILRKSDVLSAVAIKLVKLTGKNSYPIHPKHLINSEIWYSKNLKKNDKVLDLGAGSCQNDIKLINIVKHITCFDIDMKSLKNAQKTARERGINNINFIKGDANYKLPFRNSTFSKIICTDVLEHLERRDYAISEIRRVLKKKGFLFLLTDNPNTSWKKLLQFYGFFPYADLDHKYEYPKEEIIKKLKQKKFKIISCQISTYDTPFKGFIDLSGGFSLSLYKKLKNWRERMAKIHPEETTGYRIIAQKI